uniref:tRNA splicing endonuclease subunit 15 n=1 Tax=Athene cunicularia TaxID=194338 RepID=A0A663M8C0_ATHCN
RGGGATLPPSPLDPAPDRIPPRHGFEGHLGPGKRFTEMMSLDISDSAQIYSAFVVYLDLLEGRNWHEVKHVGVAELQLVCLHAREREQDSLQVMVPVPVHISLSHERIREIMKKASLPQDDPDTPLSVTLAIVESDSTVVYYKMTDGFVTPDPPDNTEDVDNKQCFQS